MKFSLRVTIMFLLLSLLTFTVAGLAYTSYRNARTTVDDLSNQILRHTAGQIDTHVLGLVRRANDIGALNAQLLRSGKHQAQTGRRRWSCSPRCCSGSPRTAPRSN